MTLESSHLRQQWAFERQLRLLFRVEDERGSGFTLALMTRETAENHYEGRYLLKIDGPKGAKEIWGRVRACDFG